MITQALDRTMTADSSAATMQAWKILPWLISASTLLIAVCIDPAFQHWFILPLMICGGIVGNWALDWLRGERDMFDPLSIFALVGVHFFFLATIMHVGTDYWMPYVDAPLDWRPWLGAMSTLNVAGLGIFTITRHALRRFANPAPSTELWQLDAHRLYWLAGRTILFCVVAQTLVYAKFGGISGYVQAFSEQSDQFNGMGIVFLFSEAAPIVAIMAAVTWCRERSYRSVGVAVALLFMFIVLKFYFGGLRGSRGHLVYGLFWVACLIHVQLVRLPRKLLVSGLLLLLPFMYAYGLYKSFGSDAIHAFSAAERADLNDKAPRTWQAVLLGDLARSDVQALILYRLSSANMAYDYDYAWGSTYVGTAALVIPRSVMPDRPLPKAKAGTDLLFGPGVYEHEFASTFAYGLTGEALLNFGLPGALLSFVPIALLVIIAQRWYYGLPAADSRWLVLPLFLSIAFLGMLWDTDVLFFYLVKEGSVPGLLTLLCSRRVLSLSGSSS
ncbi:hypothetical protein [Anatilimnocola floriformis]|uniref:hypothetical protein n=1 Tax=Anatilimnocola floriformis TaxID=2948575 RepID=UPI0020C50F49|nr:hypothetical protein [Anatilimnocola floriformis]